MARELVSLPQRDEVVRECQAVIAAAQPAPLDAFAIAVERLALHYPESRLTPQESRMVLADWRRLLGHLPADIMAAGVDAYVMSPARFFPTPGQFAALVESPWQIRQILAKRAKNALDLMQQSASA